MGMGDNRNAIINKGGLLHVVRFTGNPGAERRNG